MSPLDERRYRVVQVFESFGWRNIIQTWDFCLALAAAGIGTTLYVAAVPSAATHVVMAADFLSAAGALFGVVLAGFAIAAALLGDRYAAMLRESETSAYRLLRHFVYEGAVLVTSILATVTYRAFAVWLRQREPIAEQIALGIAVFLFVYGLFVAIELMKLVFGVADTSAALLAQSDESDQD